MGWDTWMRGKRNICRVHDSLLSQGSNCEFYHSQINLENRRDSSIVSVSPVMVDRFETESNFLTPVFNQY
ncbi:hypothetical protein BpHYR1_009061 [Brachionus plicatilis]|uniref:Uncharacterized protein n=1 Tax=Brachionus plicatilis TaxID=10195 RepID=A0A3M7QMB0_BRAPC|nr:hypothetical protein BpHYR1_009061 [Brachionus plicatilis]